MGFPLQQTTKFPKMNLIVSIILFANRSPSLVTTLTLTIYSQIEDK